MTTPTQDRRGSTMASRPWPILKFLARRSSAKSSGTPRTAVIERVNQLRLIFSQVMMALTQSETGTIASDG